MNNENEKMAMKNASPRIVVSPEDLPYFSEKVVDEAIKNGIMVSKNGEEPNMIFWPGESSMKRLFLVERGKDMLALREMGFQGNILAVTNGLEEMADLGGVVESIENIGTTDVWFCVPGKNLNADPINENFVKRIRIGLGEKTKFVRTVIEEGENASVFDQFKARADKKEAEKRNYSEPALEVDQGNEVKILRIVDKVIKTMLIVGLIGMIGTIPIANMIPKNYFWDVYGAFAGCYCLAIIAPSIIRMRYPWAYSKPWIVRVYERLGS